MKLVFNPSNYWMLIYRQQSIVGIFLQYINGCIAAE